MSLFSFFKKTDKVGKDSAVSSQQLSKGDQQSLANEIKTKLSYHPDWNVPKEQQYIFNFLANELQPLQPNQFSLSAINIEKEDRTGNWNVKAFFRSSLDQAVELGEIELFILDTEGNNIARQYFDFKKLGTIPPESARPWVFTFKKESINVDEVPEEGWQLAFNLVSLRGHQLDLDDTWKQQLPQEQQDALAEIVKTLPKLGKTEVNFTGLQVKLQENGSLAASIFIRNGNDKAINLEQLPLEIIDAKGNKVASGSFKTDPTLTIQPNSTKPWTFIFPAELVDAKDADFSRWTARVSQ